MKLAKFKVENYQSHREFEAELDPGINVFIGQSLNGKTALLRAINWPIENRPSGFRFHSSFALKEYTRVTLTTTDGTSVALKKSEKDAEYSITDKNGKITKLRKFATKVPEEVSETLQFSNLNMQGQLDQPFLATSSPGEVMRVINTITGLDKANAWLKQFSSIVLRLQREIVYITNEVKTLNGKIKKYKDMPKTETLMYNAKAARKKIDKLAEDQQGLTFFKTSLQRVHLRMKKLRSWTVDDLMESLQGVVDERSELLTEEWALDRLQNIETEIETLKSMDITDLLQTISDNTDMIDDLITEENALIDLQDVRERITVLSEINPSLDDLHANLSMQLKLNTEREELLKLSSAVNDRIKLSKHFESLREVYGTILNEIGKCPTCFTDIDGDTLSHIHKEF